mgnify:CR=1 FL=1|tara:strand:- start:149 stop:1201 length:1053 start_codon:yes stop_codon:yes gene_type:complete
MKPLKIYFLGRRSGHGLFKLFPKIVENTRKDEILGLKNAIAIQQTGSIANADILFFRNKPEKTSDALVSKLKDRIQPFRSQKLIMNDIASFYNYDSKDKAFSLWKNAGISTPEFMIIPDDSDQSIQEIQTFVKRHNQIFIRTNNETGSKGMEHINWKTSIDEIIRVVKKLILKQETNRSFRSDSNVMAVQFIDARVESGHLDLYRAHVLGNDIISYYVVTSPKDTFHNQDMTMDDLERFIWVNEQFGKRIIDDHQFKNTIINAVKVLGCNIGGIEFILKNDVPVFIEHNPMWGGRAGREGFGQLPFQAYLNNHKKELMNRIPLLFKWLDYENYYTTLYEKIRDLYFQSMN